ncbi:hypothetical protein LTR29_008436 [Friedmanniomyces endolithicus]|uniref:Methyltransferase domain-containing protein n=1 Tax=Friedmanniomyces endolithicus TaxID=329885 RepID=A0A4U0VCT5_9PEZI|nr:hypothetical protein LTS09_017796 [Friedmanniomyces endolithicus]KAK0305670.1 hypothetical protein LTR01_006817 [Friedmanniomyces endolithicus]KAK0826129.1 hypothetical protein LTR73_006462 [Friedmanniomyces endolithicus]KAK0939967.1 hypothetical protein LTR29_008436 [Friedmanniomyces endolithicus]TKA46811.1 hypothetical protein B0A54_03767 [Friedmanniomyces endolithicus]
MDGMAFAYWGPASSDQQRFTAARTAALARERERRKTSPEYTTVDTTTASTTTDYFERSISIDSAKSEVSGATALQQNYGHMDPIRRSNTTGSGSSSSSEADHRDLLNQPYELRHGRRYLRQLPYPLPVDLTEIQRQNLRTLLGCRVFGRAVCSPQVTQNVPHKVLEVGCGSAYWSAACHDYFSTLGFTDVAFTGLDVAPLPPNLNKQGVNWTFVQHDLRRMPLPFDDEEFDLVMLKDLSLVLQIGVPFQKFLDENIRLLRVGGTLEIWESDHVLRSLLPHPPPMSKQLSEQRVADQTATFLIAPGTPFAPAQNRYIQQANAWIQQALDARRLPPTPCARIAQVLYQEPESLNNVGMRRVAIPLGELRWERDSHKHTRSNSDLASAASKKKGKGKLSDSGLTLDQLALRQTALLTVLQMIESLEPLLKEVSGKNSEEWSYWWASMMADLLDPSDSSKAASTGEVLEVGAWWATKIASD